MNQPFIHEMHNFRMPVTDLQKSVKWYSEYLGFQLRHSDENLAVVELKTSPLLILVEADPDSRGHFTVDGQPEFSVGFTTSEINSHILKRLKCTGG